MSAGYGLYSRSPEQANAEESGGWPVLDRTIRNPVENCSGMIEVPKQAGVGVYEAMVLDNP